MWNRKSVRRLKDRVLKGDVPGADPIAYFSSTLLLRTVRYHFCEDQALIPEWPICNRASDGISRPCKKEARLSNGRSCLSFYLRGDCFCQLIGIVEL